MYNGDADAVSMLDELEFCRSKFTGDQESRKDEPSDASDALVEILLSFASKQSQLFRRMSEQVFSAFAESITENGLDSLISVCSCFLVGSLLISADSRSERKPERSTGNVRSRRRG